MPREAKLFTATHAIQLGSIRNPRDLRHRQLI